MIEFVYLASIWVYLAVFSYFTDTQTQRPNCFLPPMQIIFHRRHLPLRPFTEVSIELRSLAIQTPSPIFPTLQKNLHREHG